ncbi:MAG: nucleotidyltransferase domain-containing protein, partial [Caldilineaceae bacterium]|nr:nucleotidyltransferase domain-containing protein [Caldilineaceae bacterium]
MMTRIMRTRDAAISAARRYCAEHYPNAKLVLLCGSWARGTAHGDSDIDIVVLNPGMSELVFEGA